MKRILVGKQEKQKTNRKRSREVKGRSTEKDKTNVKKNTKQDKENNLFFSNEHTPECICANVADETVSNKIDSFYSKFIKENVFNIVITI